MGGQTIRLMEEFLRNGNEEEIAYSKAHGGGCAIIHWWS